MLVFVNPVNPGKLLQQRKLELGFPNTSYRCRDKPPKITFALS
jgi:hypothetical protein